VIPTVKFKRQVSALQALVWLQRSLRLCLRAAWLGLAGYLLAWGLHAQTGRWDDPQTWRLVGLLFALGPLVAAVFSHPHLGRLAWSADRKLGLKEQVSTALGIALRTPNVGVALRTPNVGVALRTPNVGVALRTPNVGVVKTRQASPLAEGLLEDAARLLRPVRKRVWLRGWFVGRELLSLVIVGALLAGVELSSRLDFPTIPVETVQVAALPPLPAEPRLVDIVPGRVPGMPPEAGAQGQPASESASTPGVSAGDVQALANALQKIGAPLGGQPATQALADALAGMDLEQAAKELQKLANQAGSLSPATKEALAQAMQAAAPGLDQAGLKDLAADLTAAANALKDTGATNQQAAQDSLNKVAGDLQSLAGQMAQASSSPGQPGDTPGRGSAAGQPGGVPQQGSPTTARLGGEGNNFELQSGAAAQSGWLVPGASGSPGTGTATGSLDTTGSGGDTVTSILMPYYYPWMFQNVVSRYFQPLQ
jgi:hypothetical protein